MHEVYAAIAITALKRQVGQKEQMSEDAFYAQSARPHGADCAASSIA